MIPSGCPVTPSNLAQTCLTPSPSPNQAQVQNPSPAFVSVPLASFASALPPQSSRSPDKHTLGVYYTRNQGLDEKWEPALILEVSRCVQIQHQQQQRCVMAAAAMLKHPRASSSPQFQALNPAEVRTKQGSHSS